MTLSRRMIAVLAASVLAIVAAAVVLVVTVDNTVPGVAVRGVPNEWYRCNKPVDHVLVYFNRDEDMRAAYEAVRDDDRIADVFTETKAEALVRFKEIFADQPELVELARVEAMPASLALLPKTGVSSTDLAKQLGGHFAAADEVKDKPCALPAPR